MVHLTRESGKAPKFKLTDEGWVIPQRPVSGRGHMLRSARVFLGISGEFSSFTRAWLLGWYLCTKSALPFHCHSFLKTVGPYIGEVQYRCWRCTDEFTPGCRLKELTVPRGRQKGYEGVTECKGGSNSFSLEWAVCSLAVSIPEGVM